MSVSLVNNKYKITRRIGGGSFGEIYLGIGPSGEQVAVKFEKQGSRCPQLRHEYKVYREVVMCHGFCNVILIILLLYYYYHYERLIYSLFSILLFSLSFFHFL